MGLTPMWATRTRTFIWPVDGVGSWEGVELGERTREVWR